MPKPNLLPSAEKLRELFTYDPLRGNLYWRVRPACNVDISKPAGYVEPNGYRRVGIRLNGATKLYFVHRLVFKWVTGNDPGILDHVGQEGIIPKYNAFHALEEVSHAENSRRAKNGKGFWWSEGLKKWKAQVGWDGSLYDLGSFTHEEDALKAVEAFKEDPENHIAAIHHKRSQRGVSWFKGSKQWRARWTRNGKEHHLGCYTCKEEALAAVDAFKKDPENHIAAINHRRSQRTPGVTWNKGMKRWVARWTRDGKRHYLGSYTDKEQALAVVKRFRES